ncbi:MAG: hypothetical protein Q4A64_05640, partial [Porphyromonadaceae bacterium]|nr:hypothetical protein [Porphyromonadaceae bacterium]
VDNYSVDNYLSRPFRALTDFDRIPRATLTSFVCPRPGDLCPAGALCICCNRLVYSFRPLGGDAARGIAIS